MSGGDLAILATTFNPLVAVFVKCSKVAPEFSILRAHRVSFDDCGEFDSQVAQGCSVELVLMTLLFMLDIVFPPGRRHNHHHLLETYLKIPQLGELFPAVIQETSERFRMLVSDFMGAHVTPLSKSFMTDVAREGLFTSVATLMGLEYNGQI